MAFSSTTQAKATSFKGSSNFRRGVHVFVVRVVARHFHLSLLMQSGNNRWQTSTPHLAVLPAQGHFPSPGGYLSLLAFSSPWASCWLHPLPECVRAQGISKSHARAGTSHPGDKRATSCPEGLAERGTRGWQGHITTLGHITTHLTLTPPLPGLCLLQSQWTVCTWTP